MPGNDGHTVDYSHRAIHQLALSGLSLEFPSLPESDESTEIYLMHLKIPREGGIVLDLGAYAGASTLRFAKEVGARGLVAAFEPDAENYDCLQCNIAAHSLTNIRAFKKGIWSSDTTLAFNAEGNMGSSVTAITTRQLVGMIPPALTEVVTLMTAAALAGVTAVHAVKMDIEGAELEVLRTSGDFLKRYRPRMVIEPHMVYGRMCTNDLRTILTGYGYSTKLVTQGSLSYPLIVAESKVSRPS